MSFIKYQQTFKLITLLTLFIVNPQTSIAAVDFDFSGTFAKDNDVVLLNFTVGADSTITIFSSSWIDGGFDPILGIWDSEGNLVDEQDDGDFEGSSLSNGVSYDHGIFDSHFEILLTAGEYIASIAQFDNFSNSNQLSDGFIYDDSPNFTFDNGFGSQANFNGVLGANDDDEDPRTGDWVFHILNIEEAAVVPVPAAIWFFGSGLFALMGIKVRRNRV